MIIKNFNLKLVGIKKGTDIKSAKQNVWKDFAEKIINNKDYVQSIYEVYTERLEVNEKNQLEREKKLRPERVENWEECSVIINPLDIYVNDERKTDSIKDYEVYTAILDIKEKEVIFDREKNDKKCDFEYLIDAKTFEEKIRWKLEKEGFILDSFYVDLQAKIEFNNVEEKIKASLQKKKDVLKFLEGYYNAEEKKVKNGENNEIATLYKVRYDKIKDVEYNNCDWYYLIDGEIEYE